MSCPPYGVARQTSLYAKKQQDITLILSRS
jgi:hypothetical protein